MRRLITILILFCSMASTGQSIQIDKLRTHLGTPTGGYSVLLLPGNGRFIARKYPVAQIGKVRMDSIVAAIAAEVTRYKPITYVPSWGEIQDKPAELETIPEAINSKVDKVATIDDDLIEIKPNNYDAELKQGAFSAMAVKEFPGVNGEGNRSNVVGSFFGYNTGAGGGQTIQGEASYRFAGETHFDIGGQKYFEFHLPEMYTNGGLGIRPFSMYIDKESGIGSLNAQINQINYAPFDNNNPWLSLLHTDVNTILRMTPPAGGSSRVEFNSGAERATLIMDGYGGGLKFSSTTGFNFDAPVTVTSLTSGFVKSPRLSVYGNSTKEKILAEIGDQIHHQKFMVTSDAMYTRVPYNVWGGMNIQYAPVTSNQDIEITDATKGIIQRSPNGKRWRVTLDNNGEFVKTAL